MKSNFIETKQAVDDITSAIDKQIASANELNTKIIALNGNYSKVPSAYLNNQKQIAEANIKIAKSEQEVQKIIIATERARQAKINTITKEARETQRLSREQEKAQKIYEKEQAKLEASQNIYNKVQAKLNALSNEYKALATRKELGLQLTQKEEQTYNSLQGKIQKYDAVLKGVDASMGKYQRNVGNYASAFNPLGNSINQLTREMPAFANSVQTGFMAISNNLPIFFDSIQNVIKQNKELQAQGQPTQSVLSQLAGSLFSWGTALSVGVTLLTVYGAQIWESISGSKAKKEALERETKALEEKNKAEDNAREAFARYSSDEISKAKILLENAKNISLSYTERSKAVKELQTRYPDYLGMLSKEEILAGNTEQAETKLNEALIKRGLALASQQAIQDEINNSLKNEKWLSDKLNDVQQKRIDLGNQLSKIDPFTKNEDLRAKYDEISQQLTRLFYLEGTLKDQYTDKNKKIQESIKFYIDQYNANAKYIGVVHEETKAHKKKTKEIEQYQTNSKKAFEENIKALEDTLNGIDRTSASYDLLEGQLNLLKGIYDELFGTIKKGQEETIQGIELTDEAVYSDYYAWLKLKEATDSYIKTLSSGALEKALGNIGLSSAKMFLDFDQNGQSTFDKLIAGADSFKEKFAITFQAVGDVAQDVFNKISELSNQRFETEKQNLANEKEIALAFAGDTASAREEIERQYQQRQKEIKRREFQAKKQQALFNIAIDTAQAIVSALPNIPLSISVGAIGLLEAGMVASQQMPEFWKGTDNAPEGWALTQERGREIITDKNGKIKSLGNDKGATPTYLNKGDKVFNNEKTMDYLMFNDGLNAILTSNSIDMPKVNITTPNVDLSPVVNAINSKESVNLNIDKSGLDMYVKNGHSTKIIMNNKVRYVGKSV